MRILLTTVAALALAACSQGSDTATVPTSETAMTAGTIDGTYKADMASAKLSDKPSTWSLKDGKYECTTCVPPYSVAADGKPQPVAGRDYWDAAAVREVDAKTIEMTRYRKGTVVGTTKIVLSDDGQTLTYTGTSSDNAAGKSVTSVTKSRRTAPAPAGAHAASGSWVAIKDGAQIAEENLMADISMKDGMVTMKLPTGEGFSAKLGGPQVAMTGDKAGAMVQVAAEGKGFKETDYVNGKAVMEFVYTPVDATTVKMTMKNLRNGATEEYTLKKQ